MPFRRRTIYLLAFCALSAPLLGQDASKPSTSAADFDMSAFLKETQQTLNESGYFGLVWWIPTQYWELALERAKQRLSHTRLDNVDWYWPAEENAGRRSPQDIVRLLTPFDPVVWDRARFELLWGWAYRFEAYTPASKRKRGYYALPLLWRDHVIGWSNVSVKNGEFKAELGYVESPPRDVAFNRELRAELDRMRVFLGLES